METRRARYRAETREEAKELALQQLATAGPAGISVNAIAKRMGMTGPALYRYFANRDELLTELIRDAYHDLADAIEAAARRSETASPAERLRAVALEFRAWALAQPHRYLLLFGTPVPGYQAPEDTIAAANRGMAALAEVITALPGNDRPAHSSTLDDQISALAPRRGLTMPTAALRRAIMAWTRIHGIVSLEVQGQFGPTGIDPGLLLDAEIQALIDGA